MEYRKRKSASTNIIWNPIPTWKCTVVGCQKFVNFIIGHQFITQSNIHWMPVGFITSVESEVFFVGSCKQWMNGAHGEIDNGSCVLP